MAQATDYFTHHQALLQALCSHCKTQLPFSSDQASDVDREFLDSLQSLSQAAQGDEDYQFTGQSLIARIVAQYSHITPIVNRDLFWYFGGDCLHYMSDDEMAQYQQVDELLYSSSQEQAPMNYADAKARIFQLH